MYFLGNLSHYLKDPIHRHLCIWIAMYVIFSIFKRKPSLFAFIMLPGTAAHECMHFIVGLLLAARPVSFSLLPRKVSRHGWVLGEVTFTRLRWWNKLPISLAPLMLMPLAAWLFYQTLFFPVLAWQSLLFKYFSLQFLLSAWPSSKDFYHAGMALMVILGIACFIMIILWFAHQIVIRI